MGTHFIFNFLFAIFFGFGYLASTLILGLSAIGILNRKLKATLPNDFLLFAPLIGIMIHIFLCLIIYFIDWHLVGFGLWILLGFFLLSPKASLDNLRRSKEVFKPFIFCSAYALICFLILIAYQYGPGRGSDLFWTIYNLTNVTPGDSPGSMFQSQFLLHRNSLINGEGFALFDRPFLGGLITFFSMGSIGLFPSSIFYENTELISLCYIYLWISLNSLFCLGVFTIAKLSRLNNRAPLLYFIVLMSPFVINNTIGLWPKLFATYILICALLCAVNSKWTLSLLLSGLAFFAHGSFLWAHLAFATTLIFFYITENRLKTNGKIFGALKLFLIASIFPALWFLGEYFTGYTPPLRQFYLYNVSTTYGLTHSVAEMASDFYKSTTAFNLTLLPFINLINLIIPYELLKVITSFSFTQTREIINTQQIINVLYETLWNRPFFAFGFVGAYLLLCSFFQQSKKPILNIALISFFILPLIPGLIIYRREDVLVTTTMVFSLIPIMLALAQKFKNMQRLPYLFLVSLISMEYLVIFLSRHPSIRYVGEFYEYYSFLITAIIIISWSICIYYLYHSNIFIHKSKLDLHYWYSKQRERWIKRLLFLSMLMVIASCVIGPLIVPNIFDKKIQKNFSGNFNLLEWSSLEASNDETFRNKSAFINLNVATKEQGNIVWINSGQSLIFKDIPIGENFNFIAKARIHEEWEKTRSIPNLKFTITISNNIDTLITTKQVSSSRKNANEWNKITIDLSQFSGEKVNIKIFTDASELGVWSLWKDLKVTSEDTEYKLN